MAANNEPEIDWNRRESGFDLFFCLNHEGSLAGAIDDTTYTYSCLASDNKA